MRVFVGSNLPGPHMYTTQVGWAGVRQCATRSQFWQRSQLWQRFWLRLSPPNRARGPSWAQVPVAVANKAFLLVVRSIANRLLTRFLAAHALPYACSALHLACNTRSGSALQVTTGRPHSLHCKLCGHAKALLSQNCS